MYHLLAGHPSKAQHFKSTLARLNTCNSVVIPPSSSPQLKYLHQSNREQKKPLINLLLYNNDQTNKKRPQIFPSASQSIKKNTKKARTTAEAEDVAREKQQASMARILCPVPCSRLGMRRVAHNRHDMGAGIHPSLPFHGYLPYHATCRED
jgi:hypothetical protein